MSLKQLPLTAGIGFRKPHRASIFEHQNEVSWIEVHPENFMVEGGPALELIEALASKFSMSFHGIGLSLGSADGLSKTHLSALKKLIDRFNPASVSEHVSWNQVEGIFLNDLLPVPYTKEALGVLSDNIKHFQDFIGQQILVENPSSYLEYIIADYNEADFMSALAESADCKILLDVNNIYVSCQNHGWDAKAYINQIPSSRVAEFHLAGHSRQKIEATEILIDTHDGIVSDPVWKLYDYALQKIGPRPTLLEWDQSIPEITLLLGEAAKADRLLGRYRKEQAA